MKEIYIKKSRGSHLPPAVNRQQTTHFLTVSVIVNLVQTTESLTPSEHFALKQMSMWNRTPKIHEHIQEYCPTYKLQCSDVPNMARREGAVGETLGEHADKTWTGRYGFHHGIVTQDLGMTNKLDHGRRNRKRTRSKISVHIQNYPPHLPYNHCSFSSL